MDAAADRPEFAPPPQPGLLRGLGLAVFAHLLLAVALTQGLQWQHESQNVVAEAELWSALPQQAAPRVEAPPPAPPAPPPPPPAPAPPVVRAPPQPDPQVQRDAQIALEREREREREKERREAAEKKREAAEKKREAEERRQAQLEREREQRRKLEAQKKREQEQARRKEEQARQLAETKRKEEEREKREQEQAAREARDARRVAQLREENMRRIQGMAGTGSPDSTGTAARSSGPSASYAGRVAALIKRNTRFVDTVAGDPPVEVEVRLAPDGTIVGQRLVKSSGNKARDEAVMRGIQATEKLPRDTDGSIHTPMRIIVRQFG